jgi:hypothetical protein
MVFSVMLWMPSWGGMINGIMTLSGAWDKLRTDPALRFSVTAVGFYGMSTFEGPVMSIRAVNSLSHYTDWTIGHVHSGAMGWVGFITFGALYWLFPVLWKKPRLYSEKLVSWHFWIATLGIVLYITAMWVNTAHVAASFRTQRTLGVPYGDEHIASAMADLRTQADPEADPAAFNRRYPRARQGVFDGNPAQITEMDALIAYLQMLGTLVQLRDVTPEQLRQQ